MDFEFGGFLVLLMLYLVYTLIYSFRGIASVVGLVYGGVSFFYLAFLVGIASAPQHSFAAHLGAFSGPEILIAAFAVIGVFVGGYELFRKSPKGE